MRSSLGRSQSSKTLSDVEELKLQPTPCMNSDKATVFERYFGYLLEVFPLILLSLIPVIGGILTTVYVVFRDSFDGRSVGKLILKTRVVRLEDNQPASFRESALRNFPLAISFFLTILPFVGHIFAAIVGTVVFVLEAISIATNKDRRRLGDKLAGTIVVRI